MNKQIVNWAFVFFSVLVPLGAWLKITRAAAADDYLAVGLCAWLAFAVLFVLEVIRADYMEGGEKMRWVIGFLFFGWFAAVLYLLKFRKVR